MDVKIDPSWRTELQDQFDSPYFAQLAAFVREAYAKGTVYPPGPQIFAAFDRTPFDKVRVVVLGQDPYHEPGQAQGLAFYVPPTVRTPPSLYNIAKELRDEYATPESPIRIPDLISWADQGVLLLNATLTVGAGMAGSHQGKGWETFTDAVVKRLSERREHLVFLLWGSYAQRKGYMVNRAKHLVLTSAHPSPLSASRGFFGCGHFKKANEYLVQQGLKAIDWLSVVT